ncbi:phosphoenolpyruvate carboxykinase (ATP) [Sulfurovum mangrovi]|uniref:hypothetical protein n=1 Tax=Sulfurovum mangrovi TaxID=2893889 RepID=UPI001E4D4F57|nr:hypothetical protein [Sulfurovum mangrovi]UFH58939.1 hypothetical protein LN246_11395 [Sulfurovum mangrovi]
MRVYGTKIKSDIDFPLDLSHETEIRYEVTLSSDIPCDIKNMITCGLPLYWAHGRHVYLYSDREFEGSHAGQPWCYEVEDVVRFYWVGGERTIYYEMGEKGDANLLGFWFIHLFLPLYMTLEDMYDFFHAGAVEVEGKPIFFIAPSMGGKSTMTDYFIKQGHRLISDDKVPTFIDDGSFMAVGSHPYHRPYRKFEELGYRVEKFTTHFKPIHAFYVLEGMEGDAEITIEEVKGIEKFALLLPSYLYMFSYLKPRRLKYLSGISNSIRVFRVHVPWNRERLGEVHDKIVAHSKLSAL